MGILEAATGAVSRLFRQQAQQTVNPATTGVIDTGAIATTLRDWTDAFALTADRRARYDDFDQMDMGDMSIVLDEMVEQALSFEGVSETLVDTLAEARCFKIDLKAGQRSRVREVIADLLTDTELRDELPQMCRDMLKYGDEFVEILWDGDEIKGLQPHYCREMVANRNNRGQMMLDVDENGFVRAYQQKNDNARVFAGWYPYEMLHFKLYPTKKSSYSRAGFFDTIRWDWKKLNWLEQGMVVARTTRAYPRLLWQRDMTSKTPLDATTQMQKFITAITRKHTGSGAQQKAPMQPDEDIFVSTSYITGSDGKMYPKQDKVDMLDPNLQGLAVISDVSYMRRKLFNRVPAATVGIQDVAQGDMTTQDLALSRFINHIQDMLELPVRLLIDRALIAQGLKAQYRVIWPRPQIRNDWKWADSNFRRSMSDQNYMGMDIISRDYIRKEVYGMTDEESAAEEEVIIKERKTYAVIAPTNSGGGQGDGSGTIAANSTAAATKKRTAGNNNGQKSTEELTRQLQELGM